MRHNEKNKTSRVWSDRKITKDVAGLRHAFTHWKMYDGSPNWQFHAVWNAELKSYVATSRLVKNRVAFGATPDDALDRLKELLE